MSLSSAQTIMDELINSKDIFRTIEQVSENDEVGNFLVYAKIVSVESNGNWWYFSCKKCPKKVNAVGGKFYCEKCDNLDTQGNMRYKIQVRVVDQTGNAVFLLWDRDSAELIGKTSLELKSEMENQDIDAPEMPKDFEYLADQNILFKLQVKTNQNHGFNKIYTVMKLVLSLEDEVSTPLKLTGKIVISQDGLRDSTSKRKLMDEFSSTTEKN
ncbi:replication protein A 70 kDa DNA-binding subunit B-like [Henckelia pumila]|uniref:replication protein A 70 kDa DNA-binding subunit B-like n=1 Tax=Henckelia pumila TaxID=405737 RepID=UPI003C6E65B7